MKVKAAFPGLLTLGLLTLSVGAQPPATLTLAQAKAFALQNIPGSAPPIRLPPPRARW